MKVRSILLEEKDLDEYLKRHWRGFDTKDYELLAAMLLARFHTKQFGGPFPIGLPIKANNEREIQNKFKTENIQRVLQSFVDEATPIDVFLVSAKDLEPWPKIGSIRPKTKGQAFQLKRLGVREAGELTATILDFL